MNRFAYRTTGFAIKALSNLSRTRIIIQGADHIPDGSLIFVINHFTRIETFLMPYQIHRLIKVPVWSLAASELFVGAFGAYLDKIGAVSIKNPDRDRLIVKSLLTGEAAWIIFPEGRMVKNKKIVEKGRFMISYAGGKHPPHTGAASLALRAEFYRQRLLNLRDTNPEEADRLGRYFDIPSMENISEKGIYIVPVNLTYYPVRAKENLLAKMAAHMVADLPERALEEIMTEGSMLLSGVDLHIRFGDPIAITQCIDSRRLKKDIVTKNPVPPDLPYPHLGRMRKAALKTMQRYMQSIYSMTTVNYDHLFASLLKHAPSNRIDKRNLLRRAYICAVRHLAGNDLFVHPDLENNPIHLLTDDRFNKFQDFLMLAEEKQVLRTENGLLMRDRSRISTVFDFHRARIDNPIAVMANEVEPLTRLQRSISRLSWTPGFLLRRKIVRILRKKALDEFEADYQRFFSKEESKPREVGRPILMKGRRRELGVLLSHGYMAAPMEVAKLAAYFRRLGYWVYAPRLTGHGTAPEDLATRSYVDWLTSMEEGYVLMKNLCRRIVVGGFSTGAALALVLSARFDDIAGVFAVSTPLRLQYITSKFAPAVDAWNRLMHRVRLGEAMKEFVENRPENPHINYRRNPVAGVRELERLMDHLEQQLPHIHIPALVVQSQRDPVVDPKGSEMVFNRLGSERKEYMLFNMDRHGILVGEGAEQVYRMIGDFIRSL